MTVLHIKQELSTPCYQYPNVSNIGTMLERDVSSRLLARVLIELLRWTVDEV